MISDFILALHTMALHSNDFIIALFLIRHPISTINLHTDGMALVSTSDTFLEASRKLKFNFQFYATLIAPQFSLKLSRNLPRKVRTLN